MRRAAAGLLLAAAALGAWVLPARAGMADRVGATFALMADDVVRAFQPVEGLVVGLDGQSVYLDLGQTRGASVGQELVIFRKGDPFYHPITGRPLGRYEDVLGWAQIRRVMPRFSEARFVPAPGMPRPQAGDGVRITRGRIKVAVTPALALTERRYDLRRVPYIVASALERSQRFQVADPLRVTDAFADGRVRVEEVLALPDRARQAAERFAVAGWLVPILLERRGTLYLDVTWISAVTGTALFSRRQPVVPAAAAEEQRFPWEPVVED